MTIKLHTVKFSGLVTFTDQTGITFTNLTSVEGATLVASATTSPARVIEYTMDWIVEPIAGDILEFKYNATIGNYLDSDGIPMADATLILVNCDDIAK